MKRSKSTASWERIFSPLLPVLATFMCVGLGPVNAQASLARYPLLSCREPGRHFLIAIDANGLYSVRFTAKHGHVEDLRFSEASEYISVNNQEPSFFLQLKDPNRRLQIYFDTVLRAEHRSTSSVKLRYSQYRDSEVLSYNCGRLQFYNVPLHGKKNDLGFVRVWTLARQGYADAVTEYDSEKYGEWL